MTSYRPVLWLVARPTVTVASDWAYARIGVKGDCLEIRRLAAADRNGQGSPQGRQQLDRSYLSRRSASPACVSSIPGVRSTLHRGHGRRCNRDLDSSTPLLATGTRLRGLVLDNRPQPGKNPASATAAHGVRASFAAAHPTRRAGNRTRRTQPDSHCPAWPRQERSNDPLATRGRGAELPRDRGNRRDTARRGASSLPPGAPTSGGSL